MLDAADADAAASNMLEAVVAARSGTVASFAGVGEEVVFVAGLHIYLAVADVGRGCHWRLVHLFLLGVCVGR